MAIPSVTIPVFGLHIVALDRREMPAPLGGRLTGWSRARAFIPVDHALRRTDMTQAVGIRQIDRGRGHFISQIL